MTAKGWGIAAAAWSVLAVLFLGVTVATVAFGLARLGATGEVAQMRLSQCRLESSRGGSHVECSGRRVDGASTDSVTLRYDGEPGDVVAAARTPWGTFEVVDKSITSWATAVLYPLLPLVATAVTAYLARRSVRHAPGDSRGSHFRLAG
ncbi:hypothetical protein ACFYOG_34360 [Streptomyces sp. NPDC007818]|uniref:hypothetical protein n=1 Tax=Streptomyces sp. NPDC007818 TaxID=3364780 RepID=UPI0036C28E9A